MTRPTRLIRMSPRPEAGGVAYDNTDSGLDADTLQEAIDELAQGGPAIHGIWRFDTSTSASDPGTGDVRYDNATPASVTNIYISQTNRPGSDCGRVFEYITSGTPMLFQQRTDAAAYLKVTASGTPTDNGAWWTIPVTVVGSGTLPANNADVSVVLFIGGGGASALDDLTDVTLTAPAVDDDLRYDGAVWVNDARKWEAVTDGEDVFVWESDDLVHEWNA